MKQKNFLQKGIAKFSELIKNNSIAWLIPIISILIGLYQWKEEQNNKRKYDLYLKKEQLYLNMQKNLWGFYDKYINLKKQQDFIENVEAAWLYCPDEIIKDCNEYIKSNLRNDNSDKKNEIIKKLILEMRKDLLSNNYLERTNLSEEDYLNVGIQRDSTNILK